MQRVGKKKKYYSHEIFSEVLINSSGNFILQHGQQIKKTEK